MSEINFNRWLPHANVKGALLSSYDPILDLPLLDQDILEVVTPTGLTISVGWFPQNDPNGSFRVTTFRRNRRNELSRTETKNLLEVVFAVVRQACADSSQSDDATVSETTVRFIPKPTQRYRAMQMA